MIVKPLTLRTLQFYNPLARQIPIKQEHLDAVAVYKHRHLAAIYGFVKGMSLNVEYDGPTAMAFFDVRIPGLKMTVVQADGNDVLPVPVDEFRIGCV